MTLPPFEAIVSAHGARVLRVCRALAGPEAAEDAWSETFLAALRAYPHLRPDSNIEAWLVTIAHRKAIDQVRRRRTTVPLDEARALAASDGQPDRPERLLIATLRELTPRQRRAVVYHYLGGLPYAEVANLLGGNAAAARRAAADGIARLRTAVSKEGLDR